MRYLLVGTLGLLLLGLSRADSLYGSPRLPLPANLPAAGSGYPLQPLLGSGRPLLSLAQPHLQPDTLPSADTATAAALFRWPGHFTQMAVDELGQLYLLTPQNELIKYKPDGQELFRYNNNTLGELAVVDVSNPFNILLFYPAHQRVVLLDRTLNPQASLDLRDGALLNAATVGLSRDNNIWVYDDWDFRLKLINARGEELLRTDDLRLSLQATETPTQIRVHRERVYLCFPGRGVAEFTNFGQFMGWLPIGAQATQLHWSDGRLYYRTEAGYQCWPPFDAAMLPLPMPTQGLRQAWWQPDRLFLLTDEAAFVWPRP